MVMKNANRLIRIGTGRQIRSLSSSCSDGTELTPDVIVSRLSAHIVGQTEAKKAVAIALRNRWRRRQIRSSNLYNEISPMNILMTGPTGSGKTEIARRIAKLTNSPFLKVEATKYTEVGVFGSNAESMVKDLTELAIDMEMEQNRLKYAAEAKDLAIDRLVGLIGGKHVNGIAKDHLRNQIESGQMDNQIVEVHFKDLPKKQQAARTDYPYEMPPELENLMKGVGNMLGSSGMSAAGKTQKKVKVTVKEALPRLEAEESHNLMNVNDDDVKQNALEKVQNNGIIFIDEIDKLADNNHNSAKNFKKGEGVQKELLALTEGCAVNTKHGIVRTDHILFIASGAFHNSNPSDLMPELQGRLPIRVKLSGLKEKEFVKILTETEYNLLDQTKALLETEGVELQFTDCAISEIAKVAALVNSQTDDVGARRLSTVISKLTEDVSYKAHTLKNSKHIIDKEYVQSQLSDIVEKNDLSKFIL